MDRIRSQHLKTILISLSLVVMTTLVYLPALRNGFVDFDDRDYVTDNVHIRPGFTVSGLLWALQGPHSGNWHPLTSASHMLDCQLFGLNPLGHHLVNVLLHVFNAALMFLLLAQLTKSRWRSAFIAAVFALHPMHVESVAWVSERKDVLSTFFGLLALMTYTQFANVRMSSGERRTAGRWYAASLCLFALSLMAKPMMVTLPFVMVLLDFWPLQRVAWREARGWWKALIVKWPFLVLSAASSVVTFLVQKRAGAVSEHIELSERIGNAFLSFAKYLGKTFWPTDLSVFYPLTGDSYPALVWGALGLFLALTGLAVWGMRLRPYLFTGWFWFAGMLVPVIGLVQVGSQAMADRYAYLPQTGVVLAVVWLVIDLVGASHRRQTSLALCGFAILGILATLTVRQIGCWRNTESLFAQAVAADPANARAQSILGYTLAQEGRREEGLAHLKEAIRLQPTYGEAYGKMGHLVEQSRDYSGAVELYEKAIALNPRLSEALNNLAWLRAVHPDSSLRNGDEAVHLAERACALTGHEKTIYLGTLAAAYAEAGRFPEAIKTATQARDYALRWGEPELAQRNEELLKLYQAGTPYHDQGMASR